MNEKKKKKKKELTTGTEVDGCFEPVQKRAKHDEKYILCERRARQKADGADDPRADVK